MRIGVTSLGVAGLPARFARILRKGGYDATFYPYDREKGYSAVPFEDIDMLWHFGGFPEFSFDILFDHAKKKNPKIITSLVWVGTDLLNFCTYTRSRPKCRECMLKNVDIHIVDCPDFAEELKSLGIEKCWYVPSVPDPMPLTPLPERFAVASYTPPHRLEFYGFPIIMEVAKEFPDVPFYLFPSVSVRWKKDAKTSLPNVHLMPFVQGDEKFAWWKKCSCFISIPIHGGVSLMAIEFFQMGRRVITNKKIPYAFYVAEPVKPDDVSSKLREIMKFTEPDIEASKHYHKEYSEQKVIEAVNKVIGGIK